MSTWFDLIWFSTGFEWKLESKLNWIWSDSNLRSIACKNCLWFSWRKGCSKGWRNQQFALKMISKAIYKRLYSPQIPTERSVFFFQWRKSLSFSVDPWWFKATRVCFSAFLNKESVSGFSPASKRFKLGKKITCARGKKITSEPRFVEVRFNKHKEGKTRRKHRTTTGEQQYLRNRLPLVRTF